MDRFMVIVIDTRVHIPLTYYVYAENTRQAEREAVKQASKDAGLPAWLGLFKAEQVQPAEVSAE